VAMILGLGLSLGIIRISKRLSIRLKIVVRERLFLEVLTTMSTSRSNSSKEGIFGKDYSDV